MENAFKELEIASFSQLQLITAVSLKRPVLRIAEAQKHISPTNQYPDGERIERRRRI